MGNTLNNIIELNGLDETDENFVEFLNQLKEDSVRAVFIVERKDGTFAVGSNSKDKRDLVLDLYRVQKFIEQMLENGEI